MPERTVCVLTPGQAGSSLLCAILNRVNGVDFGPTPFIGNNQYHKFGSYEKKGIDNALAENNFNCIPEAEKSASGRVFGVKHPKFAAQPEALLNATNPVIVVIDRPLNQIKLARQRTGLRGTEPFTERKKNIREFIEKRCLDVPIYYLTFDELVREPVRHARRLHDFIWQDLPNPPACNPEAAADLVDPNLKHA